MIITELRAHNMLVLEMEAAGDLDFPGPRWPASVMESEMPGHAANWYWGHLTQEQSLAIDPTSYPDIYCGTNAGVSSLEAGRQRRTGVRSPSSQMAA
jgi:hypothetical protein